MTRPLRRIFHWGPISVFCIIKLIGWDMVHLINMWWPPHSSIAAFVHAAVFLSLLTSTTLFFLQSLLEGPGFVPLGWKPENQDDTEYLQFCSVCKGYKPPRSHHCRKCGRCVQKMDHHCPWINCCVGHTNHRYFLMFLASAVLGCLHASIVLTVCMYHAINRSWYTRHGTGNEPMVYLTLTTLLLSLLAIGMAVGVVLAVGVLLYLQVKGVLRNRTSIEEWIVEKAQSRRAERGLPAFEFPYDVGWRANVDAVRLPGSWERWPLRAGCGRFDLTSEQLAQKADKRMRARMFVCARAYSGRWLPALSWPVAALCAPCSDEPRLPLRPQDRVRATRQRRYWLFGEKLLGPGDDGVDGVDGDDGDQRRGPRGWFPRDSVVPLDQLHPNKTK